MANKKVLIVDDAITTLEVLFWALDLAGYQSSSATTVEEGLKAIQTFKPDLIVLDLIIPGPRTWKEVVSVFGTTKIPIIVISAIDDKQGDVRTYCLNIEGVIAFFTKPMHITTEFMPTVDKALK